MSTTIQISEDLQKELLKRIILNSSDTIGKPIIKGTQLTVEHILGLLAHETPEEEIFQRYEVVEVQLIIESFVRVFQKDYYNLQILI